MLYPEDARFTHQLDKVLNSRFRSSYLVVRAEFTSYWSEISDSENTPLYSALHQGYFGVPDSLSSYQSMAWWLGMCLVLPDYDDLKRDALVKLLKQNIFRIEEGNTYVLWEKFIWHFFSNEEPDKIPESVFNPAELVEFCLENMSRDVFFGTIASMTAWYISRSTKTYKLRRKRPRKPRYPQRKREYNDKGSLRESHVSTKGVPVDHEKEERRLYKKLLIERVESSQFPEYGNWLSYQSKKVTGAD